MEEFKKPTLWGKIKRFFTESRRVLKITRKPNFQEFSIIVKISGIGILIIGIIGFIIQVVWQLIR